MTADKQPMSDQDTLDQVTQGVVDVSLKKSPLRESGSLELNMVVENQLPLSTELGDT